MKRYSTSLLLLFLIFSLSINAQVKKTFIPDLDGKVHPSMGTPLNTAENFPDNAFTVYPGFPRTGLYSVISPKTGAIYCNLDADSDMEIIFGAGETLYAVNIDSTNVPGWPKTFSQYSEAVWACSFGDVNGDGQDEIVAGIGGPLSGFLHVYTKDGTMLPGFPVNVGKYPMGPVLSDLNNDGAMEMIMGTRTGQLVVYKGDGTMYPGWPFQMDRYIAASVSVGDVDNNGVKNIVAESRNLLYVWNPDGSLLSGFPYAIMDSVNGSNSYSAPVLADLTGDGKLEIVFGSHQSVDTAGGVIYAVNYQGVSLPGFPKTVTNWIYGAPIIADVDNDMHLEIIIGEYGSSPTPSFYIFGYNHDGTTMTNFPLGPYYGLANQITVADLDNDNAFEILFDENVQVGDYGHYTALNMDGSPVAGFPLEVRANSSFQQPILGDLNNDNILDLAGGSFSFDINNKLVTLYAWNSGLPYDRTKIVNPMYQFGPTRVGQYIDPLSIPVELESFTGSVSGMDVILNWNTITEKNNSGFNIYRNNIFIRFIEGKGTSTERNLYTFTDKNPGRGFYEYKLEQVDYDGTAKTAGIISVNVSALPDNFTLEQNYPNPFNPETNIKYGIIERSDVRISVFDAIGSEVSVLQNGIKEPGYYQVSFNASELPSGIYFCKMQAGNFNSVIKMILIK